MPTMVSDIRHYSILHGLRPIFIGVAAVIWILFSVTPGFSEQQPLHHELEVEILHHAKMLRGTDTIHLPKGMKALRIVLRPGVKILAVEGADYLIQNSVLNLNAGIAEASPATVKVYYEGIFDDSFEAEPFSTDNPGQGVRATITRDAAFFLGGSGWYPLVLDDVTETFRVSVTAPKGIYAVMEGRLETHVDNAGHSLSVWSVERPSGPLALFAGRYLIQERMHNNIRIATYFFPANATLSERYLTASARHISRYEDLHGPYPFTKFAVVENFFPTGYGFPSFTLLGSRVLRLPFIPETSLRHEVAHCWWGNGVFVDPAEGNWSEGLTTYVADYLSKEELSADEARAYRLRTLEKYALVASGENDFALSGFRSRYNPASQAIGYGKAMFVFHMMRQEIGDGPFWAAFREIYAERLHKSTGWRHFMDAFARHGGLSRHRVKRFYDQWITRPGALQLAMESPQVVHGTDTAAVSGTLIQKDPRFAVNVPVEVTGGSVSRRETVSLVDETVRFRIPLPESPRIVAADPDFDLFRLLHPEEIPATVNAVKGSDRLVAVIAKGTPAPWVEIFQGLLTGLNQGSIPIWQESRFNAEDTHGKDVLFFGMPQLEKGRTLLSGLGDGTMVSADAFQVGEQISSRNADTLFAVFKKKQGLVAVFLPQRGTAVETVLDTARKITHYGRYGRLSFKGSINIGKGVGNAAGSPLIMNLENE